MNSDEVNWLLQTIEDPENAKRFLQAQYRRGRIPHQVIADLAKDRNWTDWPAAKKPAALISTECITTRQEILADPQTRYAGARLNERTLVPGEDARLAATFETWLTHPAAKTAAVAQILIEHSEGA